MKARRVFPNSAFIAASVLTLILSLAVPTQSQTVLIDFGNNLSYHGTNVSNPDVKGHYWNSVYSGAFYPNLLTTNGTAGTWSFGFESGAAGDTDAYNGPAGAVPPNGPSNCGLDSNALGDLGITNAVYDYFVNSEFQLQGLDPTKTYTLSFFGSHKYSASDYTTYYIYTNSTYSLLETSVSLFVQSPSDPSAHNSNIVATVSGVKPWTNGIIYVKFTGTNSAAVGPGQVGGYLNCMEITQVGGPSTNNPPAGPPLDKTVLIDFGNNQSYRGTNTPSPDMWGHYWNSIWSGAYYGILTNAAGAGTTLALGFDAAPDADGTDSYNGPAGVCPGDVPCPPSNCVINANALGYLGINEAVYDYYVTSAFEIQGADPTKTYSLTFYGSRKYCESDYTTYSFCSDITYSTVITSINLYVQSPSDPSAHNQGTVATITGISPQSDGIFYIKFQGTNSSESFPYGYGVLNCMQIVDLSTNTVTPPPPVDKTILVDFGNNQSYRGTNTPSPDGLGHYWNSVGGTNNYFFTPGSTILTNAAGAATAVQFAFDSAYTNAGSGFGTDSYNGPAGNTVFNGPNACVFNPTALAYLGITNAVYDYYVNAKFQLQGMDPAKSYRLTFFGSHKYNFDNTTVYSVCSDSSYSTVLASTNLLVGAGANHNQDQVATIGPISPQPNGTMYIEFIGSTGNLGYLNCLQIVDLSSNAPPSNPFATWQLAYFGSTNSPNSLPNADPDGDGMINSNEFLAGFNPTNSAAYPHILSIAKANSTNLVITYLGANGDNTGSPGITSRTNVLEFTTGGANGSYSNNFVSTGQTNILSGGTGLGQVTSFIETNVVTGPTRYYRVRVLVP